MNTSTGRQSLEVGFTLIEVIIVVALVAIMLAIAVPSFRNFITRYNLTATSNEFLSAVTLTRNEAIKRGRRVDMVPVSGNNWTTGWIVYADVNNNQIVDSGEIIFQHDPMPPTLTISVATGSDCATVASGTPFNDGTNTYIAYLGTGYPSNATITGSNGMIFNNSSYSRTLCINFIGRPRIFGSN